MYRIVIAFVALMLMSAAAYAAKTPEQNLKAITGPIKSMAGFELEPTVPGKPCINEGTFCDVMAGNIQIQVYGRGIVDLMATSMEAPSKYRKACAAAFKGLSGSAPGFATEVIDEAFAMAAATGEFKQDIASVEVTIRLNQSVGTLACRFFRY